MSRIARAAFPVSHPYEIEKESLGARTRAMARHANVEGVILYLAMSVFWGLLLFIALQTILHGVTP